MELVEEYVKANGLQTKDFLYVMDEFSDEIARMHGKCIDIGCGPGISTRLLLKKLPADSSVVGVDLSKNMIEFAEMKHRDEKRLSFVELDIAAEKLAPHLIGAFDNAVSVYCIHWCLDQRQVYKNIYSLLKPGGKGLVMYVSSHSIYDVYPKLHEYPEYKTYMKDYSNFVSFSQSHENPRAELKKIIRESGFEVLHCSERERMFILESWKMFQEQMVAVNPFVARLPKDLQKKYADDLLRELRNIEDANFPIKIENNGSTKQPPRVLTRYNMFVAYFEKPVVLKS